MNDLFPKRKFIVFIECVFLTFKFSTDNCPMCMDKDSNFKVFPGVEGGWVGLTEFRQFLNFWKSFNFVRSLSQVSVGFPSITKPGELKVTIASASCMI